jgi:hypothetical protein
MGHLQFLKNRETGALFYIVLEFFSVFSLALLLLVFPTNLCYSHGMHTPV